MRGPLAGSRVPRADTIGSVLLQRGRISPRVFLMSSDDTTIVKRVVTRSLNDGVSPQLRPAVGVQVKGHLIKRGRTAIGR